MNNAFLVRLSISRWNSRKLDRSASQDTKSRAGAGEKAGVKVYKTLLAADELDAIGKIESAARGEHQARTVPWQYDGPGAITANGYPSYKTAMIQYEKAFNAAVDRFVSAYEADRHSMLSDAGHPMRVSLGKLFNPADYPMTNELRARFKFVVSAEPLPAAENFRPVGLAPALVEEIKNDIVLANEVALHKANETGWSRVLEATEKLKLRMAEYDAGDTARFYEGWLSNVTVLAEMIPSINVANDPDLARIGQKLLALTVYDNEELKVDAGLRKECIKQAGAILGQINEVYQRAA